MSEIENNQGLQVARWLSADLGYEEPRGPGYFVKVVDDQHAAIVFLRAKDYLTCGDHAMNWSLKFGLARRDLNEHYERWMPNSSMGPGWQFASVMEGTSDRRFFTEKELWFRDYERFEDQLEVLSDALAELERWACLERIEEQLYRPDSAKRNAWLAIVNDALSGRFDRAQPYYEQLAAGVLDPETPERFKGIWEVFTRHLEEFRTAHPDGIR